MSTSSVKTQFLLKRRAGTTSEVFRESYLRHARLVLPWLTRNEVQCYAQIHSPKWSSDAFKAKYPDINLDDWDVAAEIDFDNEKFGVEGRKYYQNVILADERSFLLSEALQHCRTVEAGSFVGERIEFIRDGEVVNGVEFGEFEKLFEKVEREEK